MCDATAAVPTHADFVCGDGSEDRETAGAHGDARGAGVACEEQVHLAHVPRAERDAAGERHRDAAADDDTRMHQARAHHGAGTRV